MVSLLDDYEIQVAKFKEKLIPNEMTLPLFFILILQLVGINYRIFPTIFWEKQWERAFVPRVAQIRAVCDRFMELCDEGKVEHPTVTLTRLLNENGIDPVTIAIDESEDTVELFSAEDAPIERTSRKKG